MTQQAAGNSVTECSPVYIHHAAVVTARMPTPEECAVGYRPHAPVLVVTGSTAHVGERVKVFPADWTALVFGDPDGVPAIEEVTRAAEYVLDIITEELDNAGAKLAALTLAARTSPGSITRLADEYRQVRAIDGFCSAPGQCEHAAHAAAG